MRMALALSRRGLGRTWPNPAVGCVLVREGAVVGRGWTSPGGRPHAETEALRRAGARARGGTAYVTLEPCAHHGETGPCAEALANGGIRRAVVACRDPDSRVSGGGLAALAAAGIAIESGICEAEAKAVNAGYLSRVERGRPMVTLKLATSLDGRIATAGGQSRWITSALSRRRGHLLRASHDAVLTGSGTVLADDPELTCRLPGMAARSPVRVIVDGRARISSAARLVATAGDVPTWVFTAEEAPKDWAGSLVARGADVLRLPAGDDGRLDPAGVAGALAARGITRVLVEAGAELSGAWLRAGLVDEIAWFRAPVMLGGDARPVVDALGVDTVAEAPPFDRTGLLEVEGDLLESYCRRN